ncbi:MAG: ATP synthase F1 subunit delta [Candidatus Kapabacteria bacterium]|nr:ATP synthase F1 subunit delta [Candidatus Kapabacteria bacterium]
MKEQKVSARYAKALFDLAKENGITDRVKSDFQIMRDVIHSSRELKMLIHSPIIQHWRKVKIFQEIFEAQLSKLTMAFFVLLTKKRRESLFDDILEQYEIQYNSDNNLLPIDVHSATELSDELKNRLVEKIGEYSKMTVLPEYKIDKSLKGGFTINIHDWVFDASVKNQLDLMYKSLISEA